MKRLFNGRDDASAGCKGKKVFSSYYAAKRSSNQLNRYKDNTKANPYRCDSCRLWHVGNTMNGKGTKRRRDDEERQDYGRIEFSR